MEKIKKGKRWLAEELLYTLLDGQDYPAGLAKKTGAPRGKVSDSLKKLADRGFVRNDDHCWSLTEAGVGAVRGGVKIRGGCPGMARAPKRLNRNLRTRAWSVLRNTGCKATLPELAGLMDVTYGRRFSNNISRYFSALEQSGHLTRSPIKDLTGPATSPGYDVWRLTGNTGPLAPLWRPKLGEVFDRNTGKTLPITGGTSC